MTQIRNWLRSPIFWIAAITLLAAWLRFYRLGQIPLAFFMDEAGLGYNGWSLLTTGRDEWSRWLPLTLRSFDDWKPALYAYLTIPGIALLGLSEMTARLPAALFGSLLPLATWLMLRSRTKSSLIPLLTALIIAISPWHIEISRTAVEAGVALWLTVVGIVLLEDRPLSLSRLAGSSLLIATLFTYHSARLIAALIPLSWYFLHRPAKKSPRVLGLIIGLTLIWLVGVGLSLTASSARFQQISVFSDLGNVAKREELIREATQAPLAAPMALARIMQNKPTDWVFSFTNSYLKNSSLRYLFLGGAQPPRVEIPETGQFLFIFLPFFLLGLYAAIRRWEPVHRWLLFWLLVAPLPAALTTAEIPHTYRTVFLLVPVATFIAFGIDLAWQVLHNLTRDLPPRSIIRAVVLCFFALAIIFNLWKFWFHYSVLAQVHQPWFRQSGYETLVDLMDTKYADATRITMTNREGEPYIFFLFYRQIPPAVYQNSATKRLAHADIDAGAKQWTMLDFYTFHEDSCPIDSADTDPTHYYVTLPDCAIPPNFELLETVKFLDGKAEFLLLRPR